MKHCSKRIKETSFLGIRSSRNCIKPVYKDGLCASHYKKMIAKSIPFGKRKGYRQATQEDFNVQRTIYLKTMGSYGGHRCIKGIIVKGDYKKPTKIVSDFTLFVVRDLQINTK